MRFTKKQLDVNVFQPRSSQTTVSQRMNVCGKQVTQPFIKDKISLEEVQGKTGFSKKDLKMLLKEYRAGKNNRSLESCESVVKKAAFSQNLKPTPEQMKYAALELQALSSNDLYWASSALNAIRRPKITTGVGAAAGLVLGVAITLFASVSDALKNPQSAGLLAGFYCVCGAVAGRLLGGIESYSSGNRKSLYGMLCSVPLNAVTAIKDAMALVP
ncbi:MAG: hypothetical protein NT051_05885 [Candidatus Micrarchaeota archaeon]|nr:hypothetical protein [Candidatus Micrarchaeota archaeon]